MKDEPQLHDGLLLPGLDGGTSLGFLAAVGVFRVLSRKWPEGQIHMRWTAQAGAWRPVVVGSQIATDGEDARNALSEVLMACLATKFRDHPLAVLEKMPAANDAKLAKWFKSHCDQVSLANRGMATAVWLAALSSEVATTATSQLQTVRRDNFIGNLKSIIERTTRDHLDRSLFQRWDYADPLENQSLHLDPTEDRRHAYQWSRPSGDPDRKIKGGMLGANRLAIEAFPMFPSVAVKDKLSTLGFSGTRVDDTRWTWPVWSGWLDMDTVRSLLGQTEFQAERPDIAVLRARGICGLYRCRRILVEKTPNFTPAAALF